MKTTVTVNGNTLLGMAMLASKDETRPAIQGVRLRVFKKAVDYGKNAIWIATDGKRMGLYHDKVEVEFPTEATEPFVEFTIAAPRFIKPTKKQPMLTFEHEVLPFSGSPQDKTYQPERIVCLYRGGNLTEECTLPTGGGFPKWEQVIPNTPPGTASQAVLNPELLHGFTLAASKISGIQPKNMSIIIRPIEITKTNEEKQFVFSIQFAMPNDFYGVLMPMRVEREYTMPEYVKSQLQ